MIRCEDRLVVISNQPVCRIHFVLHLQPFEMFLVIQDACLKFNLINNQRQGSELAALIAGLRRIFLVWRMLSQNPFFHYLFQVQTAQSRADLVFTLLDRVFGDGNYKKCIQTMFPR
jgi:hypothetical protein